MESEAEELRRRHHSGRGGASFRAEIDIGRGVANAIPRVLTFFPLNAIAFWSPELGFAAAVREPLVKLQRPVFDFEKLDWAHFVWPHDRPDANLEMRDSDPTATFEADLRATDGFLDRCTLQLAEEMDRRRREQQEELESEDQDCPLSPCSPPTSPPDEACHGVTSWSWMSRIQPNNPEVNMQYCALSSLIR
ncbi:hypothetical protein GUJ93_ZPchr0010g7299 [Zizania palustris]|uniref:Uncharacterized protein n=1 Tax=Zizania palustris TaxID=103762 RepID=A0A8J6BKM9_ZIZPA|nr:hypothetical protein GUJ93_ZPchr0010g7299 [Zizania palustris]